MSPSRFWVQIVGKQVGELDKLVDQMTDYYSNPDNREFHKLADVHIGKIVAAVFRHDGKWYRARVVEIKQNEFDSSKEVCDLHFVDFGDNEFVAKDELYELRTDMLRLRFQAMECFLAGVAPVDNEPSEGPFPKWNSKAVERFEELTQVCRWKRLWSRTCAFRERVIVEPDDTRGDREPSPVPGVKLYDTKEGRDVDIAQKLIDEGWARAIDEKPLPAPAPAPPPTTPPKLPPTFGDLECSRVLGMTAGGREERAASLPHRGSQIATAAELHDESLESAKPKSFSIATGIHREDQHATTPHPSSISPNNPVMNGSAKTTNGTRAPHQNDSFINAERGIPMEYVKPQDLPPKSFLHHDSKDEFKAKINRVDSHHGNLESLSRQTPESPTKHFMSHDHKDDFKAKINRVDSHHGNLEELVKHIPPLGAIHPPPKPAGARNADT